MHVDERILCIENVMHFYPQPLQAVGVLFSPMVSGWGGGQAGIWKKFVRGVSQKP